MGQTWPLFINFGPFLIMMTNIGSTIDFELKKLRWCAWDSNPRLEDGAEESTELWWTPPNLKNIYF